MTAGPVPREESSPPSPAADHAVYAMAVAAELTGVNPAMLRSYEARGLIAPHRTSGGTRRYSSEDIAEVQHISTLLAAGLNLAGVEAVLALERELRSSRAEVARLRARLGEPASGETAPHEGQAEPRGTL